MLDRLGRAVVRRRRVILAITALFFVVAGAVGGGVASHLKTGGYNDPSSGSVQAAELLDKGFGAGASNILLLVRPTQGSLDDPAVAAAGKALTDRLAHEPALTGVVSYWSTGAAGLRSKDGTEALVLGHIDGPDDAVMKRASAIVDTYTATSDGLAVRVGGSGVVFDQITKHI
ncbi:MAG: putative drug exporter of the superfamily, partial [Frankiaceae bacterium]|nr:putative drug exporter of the superfamily [Frankiaceae bacterium]